jgi:hypothetical protein
MLGHCPSEETCPTNFPRVRAMSQRPSSRSDALPAPDAGRIGRSRRPETARGRRRPLSSGTSRSGRRCRGTQGTRTRLAAREARERPRRARKPKGEVSRPNYAAHCVKCERKSDSMMSTTA